MMMIRQIQQLLEVALCGARRKLQTSELTSEERYTIFITKLHYIHDMYFYCQLLGINPYKDYKNKSTGELTTKMIKTIRATGNVAPTYKRECRSLGKWQSQYITVESR